VPSSENRHRRKEKMSERNRKKNTLEVGDTIKCVDTEDMVETMYLLADEHVDTEFVYEMDGEKGYWLEVVSIGNI
jgi:hypothetical protein